ncbi:phosphohistidine phosphatase [Brevibacterium jeotgali]|uniref:Phosphohistidine phosphatase n=2 Tax=Brevibacterium jeotgali TaxID=1262550 RepID=A0A2H1L1Z7_9MICO|nr:phosphohistidine phosphatase [Brevibacterium jeotgali]SMY10902.1 phosphohistidine phosphatase [Brevibacterium jeotgali]
MAGGYGESMPLLVLARHAHTIPAAEAGTDDVDRPLSDAGRAQARRMGEHLATYSPGVDTVIASSAVRTIATAEAVAAGIGIDPAAVVREPSLYNGWVDDWAEAMATIPADASGAVIVGHEPTVSAVVAHVTDGGASGQVPRFPPSSIAVFRLESWDALDAPGVAGAARPELIRHFKD